MAERVFLLRFILAITLTGAIALSLPNEVFHKIKIEPASSEKINELLKQNPNLVELNRKVLTSNIQEKTGNATGIPKYIIIYELGTSTPHDRLLSEDHNTFRWNQPHDIQLFLNYSEPENGNVITFAKIISNQSSELGKVYVTAGGIGQRFINLVVEAANTFYIDYWAKVFTNC